VEGYVPDLVFAETANAFAGYVRAGAFDEAEARAKLLYLTELPLRTASLRSLAPDALSVALEHGLSVYDACYAVLAETAEAVLVTADVRLGRAAARMALLPGTGPPRS
jgi:predicted nucleic acid-binding protein